MEGYLLGDLHLKLGSKVHISDFVFAKKLFQNSFFAAKYAFLVSKYLGDYIIDNEIACQRVVLLGYGYYSELLVSHIQKYLGRMLESRKVEIFVVDNEREVSFDDLFDRFYRYAISKSETSLEYRVCVVSILPISSTLTTSAKLENDFKAQYELYRRTAAGNKLRNLIFDFDLVPNQVMVVVGDMNMDEYNNKSVVWEYWEEIDESKKIIKVRNIEAKKMRYIKYYTMLRSNWYDIHECPLCYPKKLDEEKPIYYADKAFIKPIIKNGFPRWRVNERAKSHEFRVNDEFIIQRQDNPVITGGMVGYMHYSGRGKHYYYYLFKDHFFRDNENRVKAWAMKIRDKVSDGQDKNVLLVVSDKAFDGGFINVINECVFYNRANIIKLNPFIDDVDEVKIFFKDYFKFAEKIYFVDNLIASGKTIIAVNDIVKYVTSNEKSLDGGFSLIERLDYFNYQNVCDLIKNAKSKLFCFLSLCFPVIYANDDSDCYLCQRVEKYKWLASRASLNSLEQYYRENVISKLLKVDVDGDDQALLRQNIDYKGRRLFRLMMSHYMTLLFSEYAEHSSKYFGYYGLRSGQPSIFEESHFKIDLLADYIQREFLCEYVRVPYGVSKDMFEEVDDKSAVFDNYELKITLIKVLSEPPFVHYKMIKDCIFKEIIRELIISLDEVKNEIEHGDFGKNFLVKLDYLRVLIKQASVMNASFILSEYFLLKMSFIIDSVENESFVERIGDERINTSAALTFFCVSCIKDSMVDNEPKSIRLEKSIDSASSHQVVAPLGGVLKSRQFFDMLMLENTGILMQAMDVTSQVVCELSLWDSIYELNGKNISVAIDKLKGELKKRYCENDKVLDKKLSNLLLFEQNGNEFTENFLTLALSNSYLGNKPGENKFSYEVRLKNLLMLLSEVISVDLSCGGAFILYEYLSRNDGALKDINYIDLIAYVGSEEALNVAKSISRSDRSVALEMLEGMRFGGLEGAVDYMWTVRSLDAKNKMLQFYDYKESKDVSDCEEVCHAEYKRFYYYRVNDLDSVLGRGVIVFFDKKESPFDLKCTRYMLALRRQLVTYFMDLNNDAFKADVQRRRQNEKYETAFLKFNHNASGSFKSLMAMIDGVLRQCAGDCKYKENMMLAISLMYDLASKILISRIFNKYCDGKPIKEGGDSDIDRCLLLENVLDDTFQEVLNTLIQRECRDMIPEGVDCSQLSENRLIRCDIDYFRCFVVELCMNAIKRGFAKRIYFKDEAGYLVIGSVTGARTEMDALDYSYKQYLSEKKAKGYLNHSGLISIKEYCEKQYGMSVILPDAVEQGVFEVKFKLVESDE